MSLLGKFLSYFKVSFFLVSALVFWIIFGWFADYSFPYGQVIELIICCFRGTITAKVNQLQKQLQKTDFISQIDNQQQIQRLNNLDSQAWLYLGILDRLGNNSSESNEKLAKTIEALRNKKYEILDELNPRRYGKYRTLSKIQDFVKSITSSKTQKDFLQIEKIIDELIKAVRNSHPSETIIKESLDVLTQETAKNAHKISPNRLRIIYKIAELINDLFLKELSNFEPSDIDKLNETIIQELKEQINIFSQQFKNLLEQKYTMQQELQNYNDKLNSLNKLIFERENEEFKLREELKKYISLNQDRQNSINNLQAELNRTNKKLIELKTQRDDLDNRVNQLIQNIKYKQNEVEQLTKKLNKYSEIRFLEGDYIGNLSNKNSKYHFNRKCNHWKMLVGEYVLKLDGSREIRSSSSPSLFIKEGLEECDICSERKS